MSGPAKVCVWWITALREGGHEPSQSSDALLAKLQAVVRAVEDAGGDFRDFSRLIARAGRTWNSLVPHMQGGAYDQPDLEVMRANVPVLLKWLEVGHPRDRERQQEQRREQARGAHAPEVDTARQRLLQALRDAGPADRDELKALTGVAPDEVGDALYSLQRDRLVEIADWGPPRKYRSCA